MVFIVDIRRGNLDLQLLYKAIFELSADRADFVSLLFSRKRAGGADHGVHGRRNFCRVLGRSKPTTSSTRRISRPSAISSRFTHGFDLPREDLEGILSVYRAFGSYGPKLNYSSTGNVGGSFQPTYAELMTATDGEGSRRGYLASEENYKTLKELEAKNLICAPWSETSPDPRRCALSASTLQEKGRDGVGVLPVQRRDVPADGWDLEKSSAERRRAAARRIKHVHFVPVRRFGSGQPNGLASELGPMATEVKDCR